VTKPIARDRIYRRRSFNAEIIELCVRWYISYRLSYRDLVELMADRGGRCIAHHDHAMGDPIRARVRRALEPIRSTRGQLVACG
jgi:hypothetical protein